MNPILETPATATKPVIAKLPKSGVNILLVDDDLAFRQVLLRLLTDEDYQVFTADSGTEVLEMVDALKIDLVLLNLNVPDHDGPETLEQLVFRHPLLPIVLIAAHANDFSPALAPGVWALLEKPLDFVKLFQTIHQLLEESDELRQPRITQQPGM